MAPEEPDTPTEPSTPSGGLLIWPRVVALVVAVSFLAGVIGYRIGLPDGPDFNDVDVGFLADMSAHHEGALSLAFAYFPRANDEDVRQIAGEIVRTQSIEINLMNVWLQEGDDESVNAVVTDDIAMEWMGEAVDATRMPGMATAADFEELLVASGVEADAVFTRLMIDHHAAGVDMADYEATNGNDERVRNAARGMAANQRAEIARLNTRRQALGLEPHTPRHVQHGDDHGGH